MVPAPKVGVTVAILSGSKPHNSRNWSLKDRMCTQGLQSGHNCVLHIDTNYCVLHLDKSSDWSAFIGKT